MIESFTELTGWESLELQPATLTPDQIAEARRIATTFHECFRTESGQFVLDYLIKLTILRPTVTANSTQFEAGIREGKADLVRMILVQMEVAESEPQP